MQYIDIHTHQPEAEKNVRNIINIDVPRYIHCCGFDLQKMFSLGIHPWHIKEDLLSQHLRFIEQNAQYSCIKAIGECGLDKLSDTDWHLQEKVFISQIAISEKTKKPLIIHCVKAFDELFAIRKEIKPKQAWIVHGFRGKPQQAEQLITHGIYLSFGSQFNEESIKNTPIDKLFLETDDKATSIKEVYRKASDTLNVSEQNLAEQINKNFALFF